MIDIYPITALQKQSAEVRAAARENIVHITENGRSMYIFATEETFDEYVRGQRAEAAREALLFAAIDQGVQDVRDGRVASFAASDDLIEYLEEVRAGHLGGEVA